MATDTSIDLRNKIIYEVYVRNHSQAGTFQAVEEDLDRIKSLGTDILWLMPIHPIGEKNKKGELGCPYAVQNYRQVNPEYGTLDDFRSLVTAAHERNMKVMIDIVYNHTSPDSKLFAEHPDWFYRTEGGNVGNKIGDWYDVVDLDYDNQKLWDYQIETLKYWVKQGVDGFRCDVAPLVPLEFWKQARQEVAKVKENVIWLAESVEPVFLKALRQEGFTGFSDAELYQAFDVTYSYDSFQFFKDYMAGGCSLEKYLDKLSQQAHIYPANYVKMRFLENHDQLRARKWLSDKSDLWMWTAFYYFQQGLTLLYAGQETKNTKTPSLFTKDPINWKRIDKEYISFLQQLADFKRAPIFADGQFQIHDNSKQGVAVASYETKEKRLIGIFNLERKYGTVKIDCPDGEYTNLITKEKITVNNNSFELKLKPVVLEVDKELKEEKINLAEL